MGSSSNESNSLIVCNMKYLAILAIALFAIVAAEPEADADAAAAYYGGYYGRGYDTDTDTVLDTEDTMVDTTVVHTEVTTDTITAKDLLKPNPRLKLKPESCTLVPTVHTLTLTDILMDTDSADTELLPPTTPVPPATNMFPPLLPPMVSLNSTKDLLMLNLPLILTTDTTAVDTDTDTDTVMAVTTVMVD